MCLDYVQGGRCLVDGEACKLGSGGRQARNNDGVCERHGPFDVWQTGEDRILISDLGGPFDEVKTCFALGVSLDVATQVAGRTAAELNLPLVTTQRKCNICGTRFWAHRGAQPEVTKFGRTAGYFCLTCLRSTPREALTEHWMEIEKAEQGRRIRLDEWCG